ncbi:LicD family protein [Nocardioides cynanchi]|uniref:LicD family protein n=1 Tax=Nocardioides cynanchi TaxID=2558918 RepID=UPI001246FB35|nr:LicD family protein [Nocardioides cynanchi]
MTEDIPPPGSRMIDSPEALQAQLRDMLRQVADVFERRSISYFLCAGTALGACRGGDLIPWDFDVDLLVPLESYGAALEALRDELPPRYDVLDPWTDPTYEQLFGRVHLASVHHKYVHIDLFPLGGTYASRRAQHVQLRLSGWLRTAFYGRTRLVTTGGPSARPRALRLAARAVARAVPRRWLLWSYGALCGLRSAQGSSHLTNLAAGYLEREAMPRRIFDGGGRVSIAGHDYRSPSPLEEYLERLYDDYATPPPPDERARLFDFFDSWYLPTLRDVPLDVAP